MKRFVLVLVLSVGLAGASMAHAEEVAGEPGPGLFEEIWTDLVVLLAPDSMAPASQPSSAASGSPELGPSIGPNG